MTSDEFTTWAARMASSPAPPADETLVEQRARIDAVMSRIPIAPSTSATDVLLGGVPGIECKPDHLADDAPTLLYVHGGGFRMASAVAYRAYCSHLAAAAEARVISIDYRLAPEHPYPAALDDVVSAYRTLIEQGNEARRLVVAGDSAGGGLVASLFLRAKADGLEVPAGLVCCSPWVDLTVTAATYEDNAGVDRVFSRQSAEAAASMYLDGHGPRDPLVSPVFGDWTGAPPMLIQVGDVETLLDDARGLAAVAEGAGIDVTLHVAPGMPHIWPVSYPAFPEAVSAVDQIATFVHRVTG